MRILNKIPSVDVIICTFDTFGHFLSFLIRNLLVLLPCSSKSFIVCSLKNLSSVYIETVMSKCFNTMIDVDKMALLLACIGFYGVSLVFTHLRHATVIDVISNKRNHAIPNALR